MDKAKPQTAARPEQDQQLCEMKQRKGKKNFQKTNYQPVFISMKESPVNMESLSAKLRNSNGN